MENFYTIKETAEKLGVKEITVRSWIAKGNIKSGKLFNGRTAKTLIPKSEVDRILNELLEQMK